MPAVYSIVSFFSYRYYTEYEYYILAETAYEAVTLSAFLMLLMELVSMGTVDLNIGSALAEKDKKKFPFPFGFWRFRASKPYFWHALSFSVMQYVVLRPLISVIGIICQYYGVLCPEEYSIHYAEVYLDAVDFVSISVALYGLIVFYVLCKDELKGKKPLNKFLAIKLIVFFTFYQSFLFSILQSHGVIKATAMWTATNVSDGLSALCTCVEMVFFSVYMGWAYNWTDYTDPSKNPHQRETNFRTYLQAIWDTVNLSDFGVEVYRACRFFVNYARGKPGTHSESTMLQRTFMPDTIPDQSQEIGMINKHFSTNSSTIDASGNAGVGVGVGGGWGQSYAQDGKGAGAAPMSYAQDQGQATQGQGYHQSQDSQGYAMHPSYEADSPGQYRRVQTDHGDQFAADAAAFPEARPTGTATGTGQEGGRGQAWAGRGGWSGETQETQVEARDLGSAHWPEARPSGNGNGNEYATQGQGGARLY
ncbi:hypothetical protein B9479_005718 [Cryptococcus floricola]|uniref:Transmembrane protein 184C n=1 Tax=Cryptococcus floricola TaxID=2591691 RepID=A0A5D3ATU1_9TREE|nr:hypothetical protein B9479_005718 [Cryptococcus floricola]